MAVTETRIEKNVQSDMQALWEVLLTSFRSGHVRGSTRRWPTFGGFKLYVDERDVRKAYDMIPTLRDHTGPHYRLVCTETALTSAGFTISQPALDDAEGGKPKAALPSDRRLAVGLAHPPELYTRTYYFWRRLLTVEGREALTRGAWYDLRDHLIHNHIGWGHNVVVGDGKLVGYRKIEVEPSTLRMVDDFDNMTMRVIEAKHSVTITGEWGAFHPQGNIWIIPGAPAWVR